MMVLERINGFCSICRNTVARVICFISAHGLNTIWVGILV